MSTNKCSIDSVELGAGLQDLADRYLGFSSDFAGLVDVRRSLNVNESVAGQVSDIKLTSDFDAFKLSPTELIFPKANDNEQVAI